MNLDTANFIANAQITAGICLGIITGICTRWAVCPQEIPAALRDFRETRTYAVLRAAREFICDSAGGATNSTGPDSPVKGCQCVDCRRHRWEQQGRPPL